MRTIKFRAWNKQGSLMMFPEALSISYQEPILNVGENYIERPECDYVLMEYTGLKDKNGKEIYEGDIYKYNNRHIDTVEHLITPDGWSGFKLYSNIGSLYKDIEVIGNIYENPDLLKENV